MTLVVVNGLWVWNELLIALVFLPSDELKTLMGGVTVFQSKYNLNVPERWRDAARIDADVPRLPLRSAVLHPRPDGRGGEGMTRFEGKTVDRHRGADAGSGAARSPSASRPRAPTCSAWANARTAGGDGGPVRVGLSRDRRRLPLEDVGGWSRRPRSRRWERIDVLVNNAGIDDETPFLDIERCKTGDAVIATNLTRRRS